MSHLLRLRMRRWAVVTALLAAVACIAPMLNMPSAHAVLPGPVTVKGEGFDTATSLTTGDFSDLWGRSPYYAYGFYLGGVNAGGANPGHNELAAIMTDGFAVGAIWVGPQSLCVSGEPGVSTFSNTPATAQEQGEGAASNAVTAAENDGFGDVYIYYDIEGLNSKDRNYSTCVTAAESFINGWSYEMDSVLGDHAGVYGSSCGSIIADFTSHSNVPEAIWPAEWGVSDKATSPLDCIGDNQWSDNQRIHQWSDGTSVRYDSGDSGPEYGVDEDCFDAPVQGTAGRDKTCS